MVTKHNLLAAAISRQQIWSSQEDNKLCFLGNDAAVKALLNTEGTELSHLFRPYIFFHSHWSKLSAEACTCPHMNLSLSLHSYYWSGYNSLKKAKECSLIGAHSQLWMSLHPNWWVDIGEEDFGSPLWNQLHALQLRCDNTAPNLRFIKCYLLYISAAAEFVYIPSCCALDYYASYIRILAALANVNWSFTVSLWREPFICASEKSVAPPQSWGDVAVSVFYSVAVRAGTDGGDVP